ncbi:MAG: aminotransferase class V-fold PLP-dependent enzyme [Planctomycetota bacterium]
MIAPSSITHPAADAWDAWREDMPIAQRFAYFDHAAVGPLYGPAARAIERFAVQASTLGDTVWPTWNDQITRARQAAADLMDADVDAIAMIPNTTTGINLVAEGWPWKSGDEVILPEGEFPSNLFPWQNQQSRGVHIRYVPRRDGAVIVDDLIDAIGPNTRMIATSWVGYATGFRVDLDALVQRAHERGVMVFVDAIQGLGMFPLSLRQTPIDFLAADGHKWLLGPEGIGVAMIQTKHLDTLRCCNVGWGSVKNSHDYQHPELILKSSAARFECGSPNMVGSGALAESMVHFARIHRQQGPAAIADRVLDLASEIADRLQSVGAVVERTNRREHQSGIVPFRFEGMDPVKIRARALQQDVVTSCRGGGVRVAVHAYNNAADIDRLVAVADRCRRAPVSA